MILVGDTTSTIGNRGNDCYTCTRACTGHHSGGCRYNDNSGYRVIASNISDVLDLPLVRIHDYNFRLHRWIQEMKYQIILRTDFPVRVARFYRKIMFDKSGFLGRVGKKRKN